MGYTHIYSDESNIQGQRYMLIGGLWVADTALPAIRAEIDQLRYQTNLYGELKWKKVSQTKLSVYQGFVDIFMRQPLVFNCIVVDVTTLDHSTFNRGDDELGFYKFYYLLISRKLLPGRNYLVFTDHRSNRKSSRLEVLKIVTNRWWAKQHSQPGAAPVRAVEARDSKQEDLIQLGDVLLGAVGYTWNGRQSSPAKMALISYIQQKLGGMPLHRATPANRQKFNIWHWQPSAASLAKQKQKRPGS
jgi:hypothetical protein